MPWDKEKAIQHLRSHVQPPYGVGQCATYVREAIEAGGLSITRTGSGSAKDYGPRLIAAGFRAVTSGVLTYKAGDVAVIDGFAKSAAPGIKKDHLDGHLAMYDGTQWISDFAQGADPNPGSDYRKASPSMTIYRYEP